MLWILGAFAAAGFASCLPPSKAWPLPTGLGGVVGDALLRAPAWLFGAPLSGAPRFTVAIVIGIAAFVALALAAGFGWRRNADDEADEAPAKPARKAAKETKTEQHHDDEEEPAEPRSFVSLGWLYHFGYSVKAHLALLPIDADRASVAAAPRASCRCATIRPPSR